jgi:hypothetical protein
VGLVNYYSPVTRNCRHVPNCNHSEKNAPAIQHARALACQNRRRIFFVFWEFFLAARDHQDSAAMKNPYRR